MEPTGPLIRDIWLNDFDDFLEHYEIPHTFRASPLPEYLLHLPKDLPKKAPLVVFLHGYHGDARDYAEMGMSRVADAKKFAVVYPQGLPDRRRVPHWNARLKLSTVDDIGFLKAFFVSLQKKHGLDA